MLLPLGERLLRRWVFVLVRVGPEFVAPYTPGRMETIRAAQELEGRPSADFIGWLERVQLALLEPEFAPGNYFPGALHGAWLRKRDLLQKGALPRDAGELMREPLTPGLLAPYCQEELVVDKSGRWSVGPKAVTGRVLRHFLRHLHFDAELGCYYVRQWLEQFYEKRYVHHHSPPLRVRAAALQAGGVMLHLNDGTCEPLRPETLRLDKREQLFCAVKPERLPAWFEERARWELLKDAEEAAGGWELNLPTGRTLLDPALRWSFMDRIPG